MQKKQITLAKAANKPAEERLKEIFEHIMVKLVPEVKRKFNLDNQFELEYKIDFGSSEISCAFAMKPPIVISLGVKRFLDKDKESSSNPKQNCLYAFRTDHIEYPAFATDSEIGSLNKLSMENIITVLCLHELAHSVQLYFTSSNLWDDTSVEVNMIIQYIFTLLNKLNKTTMSEQFLRDYIDGTIKNKMKDSKTILPIPVDDIVDLIFKIGVSSKPNKETITNALQESGKFEKKDNNRIEKLKKTLSELGCDLDNPDVHEHGYLFQFIYKIIRAPYNTKLKSNETIFIIENTIMKRTMKTYIEFLNETQEPEKKEKMIKYNEPLFSKGKVSFDNNLFDEIQEILKSL